MVDKLRAIDLNIFTTTLYLQTRVQGEHRYLHKCDSPSRQITKISNRKFYFFFFARCNIVNDRIQSYYVEEDIGKPVLLHSMYLEIYHRLPIASKYIYNMDSINWKSIYGQWFFSFFKKEKKNLQVTIVGLESNFSTLRYTENKRAEIRRRKVVI